MNLWNRWNRTEGGYERADLGLLAAFGLVFVIFAGFFALGVMLK